jgi:hypothetical protein
MAQYADITQLIANPVSSIQGGQVNLSLKIKNLYYQPISVMSHVTLEYGVVPWPSVALSPDWITLEAYQEYTFTGMFYMPNATVKVHGHSLYYNTYGSWSYDDEMIITVQLAQSTAGQISNLVASYAKV